MTMRLVRSALAALLLAAAATMVAPSPAFACSCVGGTPAEFAAAADVVVVGTMDRRTEPKVWETSADPAAYTLTVERVYKGTATRTLDVLTPMLGASCGLENIELGEEYVVFAGHESWRGETTDELWATLCGGTDRATPALVAAVEAATGDGRPPEPGTSTAELTTAERPGRPPSATADDQISAPLAAPAALASGGALAVLTGLLWVRFHRR